MTWSASDEPRYTSLHWLGVWISGLEESYDAEDNLTVELSDLQVQSYGAPEVWLTQVPRSHPW